MNPMLHVYYINLRNGTVHQKIAKPISGGSINADQFEIHLQDCGQIVDLSSATVIGAVYRPDNSVVPLTAVAAKDDAVLITLDKYCYAIPGMITLKVKIADEGILRTALSISMTVDDPDSAVIINNETLGTLSELVEAIDSMNTAAAEAQQVVDQAREDLLTTTEEANASMQATETAANESMRKTEAEAIESINAAESNALSSMQETKDAATATMEETASTANRSMAEVADTAVSSIKSAEDNAKAVLDKSASDLAGYVTRTEDAEAGAKAAQSAAEASARSAKASAESASRVATGVANSVNLVAKKAEEAQQSAKEAFNQALNASFDATQAYTHASAAEHSANAAEASRQAAQAVLESIPHDYSNLSKMADGVAIIAEASGAIISVHDGAVVDAVSLVSHIAPASDGSGWNAVNVHRTGKNLLSKTTNDVEEITYTKTDGSSSTLYGYHVHLPAGDYQVSGSYKEGYSGGVYVSGIIVDAAGVVSQSAFAVVNNSGGKTVDLTLGDSESLILYNVVTNDGVSGTVTKFKKVNLGIYIADNDTEYEEYVGVTLTAELPETVYGGTLDWVKGVLTSTLDSAGNALHTPKEYLLTPQQLEMLYGCNAVWSDCGDTAVSYVVDTKTYVDEHAVGGDVASVASVNGKTGAVELNAADVGAMPADAQIVDDDAREQIAALSEEMVKSVNGVKPDETGNVLVEIKGGAESVTLSGNCITCDVPEDTRISLSSETDDSVTLVHIGKNFLPRPIDNQPSKTQSGITGTANEDGSLTLVGTCTSNYSFYLMHSAFGTEYIFPAGTYCVTMSYDGDYTPVSNAVAISLAIQKKDSDGTYTMVSNPAASAQFTSFTLEEPSVMRVWVGVGNGVYTNAVWRFQIDRKGDAEFEPYKRTVYTHTSFPTQIEAYQGVNNFYTESGDMLTAEYTPSEKAAILEEVKKLLKNYATPGTDFTTVKTLVLGDSISTDYYGNYNKWVTVLINSGFFSPVNVNNSSVHATGFVARKGGEANDFISRVTALTDKDTYDLVVVFGGINDYIQSIPMGEAGGDILTEFKPAVDYFFDYMINNFTQARIVVLSPLRMAGGETQAQYSDYIKQVAKSYSLPVLNLTDESGFCPSVVAFKNRWTLTEYEGGDGVTGDGVHPNEEYERRFLAPMIRAFLQSVM